MGAFGILRHAVDGHPRCRGRAGFRCLAGRLRCPTSGLRASQKRLPAGCVELACVISADE
jgi:hypothetical protein